MGGSTKTSKRSVGENGRESEKATLENMSKIDSGCWFDDPRSALSMPIENTTSDRHHRACGDRTVRCSGMDSKSPSSRFIMLRG